MSAERMGQPEWMVRWSAAQGAGIGAVITAVLLTGTIPVAGAMDVVFFVAASVSVALSGWFYVARRRLDALPLQLSAQAVSNVKSEHIKVRAWLGLGRVVRGASAVAHANDVELGVSVPNGPLCGPFTIAINTAGAPPSAVVSVRVSVREGDRDWVCERDYTLSQAAAGRFAPPMHRGRRRWEWSRASWDVVE